MSTWTTLRLRTVTPLFSGDDPLPPDGRRPGTPVRVPSIRGQLRFWFRALAAAHGIHDPQELWEQEEQIFGSTRRGTTTASAITLRIDNPPGQGGRHTYPDWMKDPDNGFSGTAYLLGQGLWHPKNLLTRDVVTPGATFDLKIRFSRDDTINTRFLYTVWAWLTFGGLGARTRRGFGQLRLQKVTDLPDIWWPDDLQTRPDTIDGWKKLIAQPIPDSARACTELGWNTDTHTPPEQRPEFPVLAAPWWNGRVLPITGKTLADVLDSAGQEWRKFILCGALTYRTPNNEIRNNTTPEWRAVITGTDTRFPRGALGMPVGYHRPKYQDQPAWTPSVTIDGGALRRASPIWLRPTQLAPNTWIVFTHAFRSRLLPGQTHIAATHQPHTPLQVTDDMADTAIHAWLTDRTPQTPRIPPTYYP
ncbi:type III-B CRISPR module RAMP protein Cmr1 [Nocardia sp. NPDC003482]